MIEPLPTKTAPFSVTRIPAANGEWIDIHLSERGTLCLQTSGYAELDGDQLIAVIQAIRGAVASQPL